MAVLAPLQTAATILLRHGSFSLKFNSCHVLHASALVLHSETIEPGSKLIPGVCALVASTASVRRGPVRRRTLVRGHGSASLPSFPGIAGGLEEVAFVAGERAVGQGPGCKVVHFMRHGEALVNAAGRAFPKGDPRKSAVRKDPKYFDSPLSERGFAQSAQLRAGTLEGRMAPPRVDLVAASPLTRAIQTATVVFGSDNLLPVVAPKLYVLEALREFCSKDFQPCDQRRSRDELEAAFSHADFRHVPPGADTLLGPGLVETPDSADLRIRWLFAWLREQSHRSIACVAHMQILTRIFSRFLEPKGFDGSGYGDLGNLEIRSVPIRFD